MHLRAIIQLNIYSQIESSNIPTVAEDMTKFWFIVGTACMNKLMSNVMRQCMAHIRIWFENRFQVPPTNVPGARRNALVCIVKCYYWLRWQFLTPFLTHKSLTHICFVWTLWTVFTRSTQRAYNGCNVFPTHNTM